VNCKNETFVASWRQGAAAVTLPILPVGVIWIKLHARGSINIAARQIENAGIARAADPLFGHIRQNNCECAMCCARR
jgi:hypothetical protein